MYGINTNKEGILFKKGERRGGGCNATTTSWFASKHDVDNASQCTPSISSIWLDPSSIKFKSNPIDFGIAFQETILTNPFATNLDGKDVNSKICTYGMLQVILVTCPPSFSRRSSIVIVVMCCPSSVWSSTRDIEFGVDVSPLFCSTMLLDRVMTSPSPSSFVVKIIVF